MKKKILIAFAIVIVLIGSLLFVFKKEIDLLYTGYFASEEQIEKKAEKNIEKLGNTLEEKYSIDKKQLEIFSKEDEEALMSGELSAEEVKEKIIQSSIPIESVDKNESSKEEIQKQTCQKAIADDITEIYIVKADYIAELRSLESTIAGYYNKLRAEGQSKATAKVNVASNYTQTMVSFQKRCDDSVNEILTDLEKVLKENKGDLSVISQMRNEYESLKKSKLNQYMARMKK